MELAVHETPKATAEAVASLVAEAIAGAESRFTLGFAGGSTPRAAYLAMRERVVGWGKVAGWLSDERWVPPDHPRSNGLMVAEALMAHTDGALIRPPWSERGDPAIAAARYEADVRSILDERPPDLILLGMGEDGHTASLFPGASALRERERWIVANDVPGQPEARITATYPLLWTAERLIMLTTGEAKAPALRDSLEGGTPAGRVGEGDARVEWHVDAAAASLL